MDLYKREDVLFQLKENHPNLEINLSTELRKILYQFKL